MTSQEKIEQLEYNLKRMIEDVLDSTFRFDLSNFLTSARSIFWQSLHW